MTPPQGVTETPAMNSSRHGQGLLNGGHATARVEVAYSPGEIGMTTSEMNQLFHQTTQIEQVPAPRQIQTAHTARDRQITRQAESSSPTAKPPPSTMVAQPISSTAGRAHTSTTKRAAVDNDVFPNLRRKISSRVSSAGHSPHRSSESGIYIDAPACPSNSHMSGNDNQRRPKTTQARSTPQEGQGMPASAPSSPPTTLQTSPPAPRPPHTPHCGQPTTRRTPARTTNIDNIPGSNISDTPSQLAPQEDVARQQGWSPQPPPQGGRRKAMFKGRDAQPGFGVPHARYQNTSGSRSVFRPFIGTVPAPEMAQYPPPIQSTSYPRQQQRPDYTPYEAQYQDYSQNTVPRQAHVQGQGQVQGLRQTPGWSQGQAIQSPLQGQGHPQTQRQHVLAGGLQV